MIAVVIDTNVLLVANGDHTDVSPDCRKACIARLLAVQGSGAVVVDDGYRIIGEYLNKTRPNQPKGAGDAFLKWLLTKKADATRVHWVSITETAKNTFSEFPDQTLQPSFDAPDRKFAAVANAHPDKPPIWQAADCKWLAWWPPLAVHGVVVDFLCPIDATKFYKKKFPGQPVPALPVI